MNPAVLQATLDKISVGTVYLDASGVIQGCNSAWKELACNLDWRSADEAIGRCYEECAPIMDSLPEFKLHIDGILSGGADEYRAHVVCGTDGDQRVLEICARAGKEEFPGVFVQHRERLFMAKAAQNWMCHTFMELFFEKLSSGVIFQSASGKVELANYAATQILSLPFDQLFDADKIPPGWRTVDAFGQPLALENFPAMLALKTGEPHLGVVVGVERTGYVRHWIRVDAELIYDHDNKGQLLGVLSSFTDITVERRSQEEISKITERLRLALDGAKIGIWDWYIGEKKMVWDERMYDLYGYKGRTHLPVEEIWARSTKSEERKAIYEILKELKEGKEETSAQFKVILPDQSVRHLRAQARAVLNSAGEIYRVVGINWDVTKEVETEQRLKEMAFQDELTGLPNRIAFNFQLERHINKALRKNERFAVLVMDLDNFKDINDSFGHPTGDTLLTEVVNRVLPIIEANYLFVRLGGDEFGLLISDDMDNAEYLEIAGKIQSVLMDPVYLLNGPAISVRASVGLSIYPDNAIDAVGLVKAADLAMYHSKDSGRDRITWYEEGMTSALKNKVDMENKLREAIRDEEFSLYYQPILDLQTNKIVGCEALIRWFDSKGNFISPVDFIPAAETSGLIYELGTWVNYTAFKQFKLWQVIHTSLEYISVNVSPHQLHYARFFENLMEAVNAVGISPTCVQLEITEGTFLQESENAESHLKALEEAGFRLAIDDFGTGYSSLSYLKRFNVDVIKIDKSFIDDIETAQADRDIVKAIMAMTSSLGFQTLVEGIEKKEQADIVKEFGCGYAQGYYYGRPINADEFAEAHIGLSSSNP